MDTPWVTAAAILLATVACAAAGYVVGHSKDQDSAPAATTSARGGDANTSDSADAPTDTAEQRGYDKAFAKARGEKFGAAFARAYRDAYVNVFEAAGLQPPKDIQVPDAQ